MLDTLNRDEFSVAALTSAMMKLPHTPQQIARMGLFEEESIRTNSANLEEMAGSISLVPAQSFGGSATQMTRDKAVLRNIQVPHYPLEDTVMAAELIGKRAFGTDNEVETAQSAINKRLAKARRSHEANIEFGRICALTGHLYDANGTDELIDWFNVFGLSQTTVPFLGGSTTKVRNQILGGPVEAIENALGADSYEYILAIHGAENFKELIGHKDVENAYDRWNQGSFLREDPRYVGFEFPRGVIHIQYRGKVGGVPFVKPNESHFVPVGVPGLFKTVFGPADFLEAVGEEGLPMWAKVEAMDFNRGAKIHTQSNALSYCSRPELLVKSA